MLDIRIFESGQKDRIKSGYGLMAAQIANGLSNLGHNVSFFPRQEMEDITLWIRPPHYIKYPEFAKSKKNVFFTMHETETFEGWKKDWPELLNKCDAIITPTEWNKQVFVKNGVKKPIFVVPLGVSSKQYRGGKSYEFSIMALHDALGSNNSREDWKTTIKAYFEAFPNNEQVFLTIKSWNINRRAYYNFLESIKQPNQPQIDIVECDFVDAKSLNNLYSKHWLFIKNAFREGWSLPLLEAISGDLTVLFTNIPSLEWAKGYDKGKSFELGNKKQLIGLFQEKYKQWKHIKSFVNQYSWKKCAEGVELALKTI